MGFDRKERISNKFDQRARSLQWDVFIFSLLGTKFIIYYLNYTIHFR